MSSAPLPRVIDVSEYDRLVEGAAMERARDYRPCTTLLPDGRIAKIFRPVPRLSSRMFRAQSQAFARVAARLSELGVLAPTVTDILRLDRPRLRIVCYQPVPGQSVRLVLKETDDALPTLHLFIAFLAHLHEKGVFFRGVHLGNVIMTPEGRFGLIDFVDTRFFNRPLSVRQRVRNFRHFCLYHRDTDMLRQCGIGQLVDPYLAAATLDEAGASAFRRALSKHDSVRL